MQMAKQSKLETTCIVRIDVVWFVFQASEHPDCGSITLNDRVLGFRTIFYLRGIFLFKDRCSTRGVLAEP